MGHGGHTTVAGERLLARIEGSRLSKERLEALTHLMRAVDVADLDKGFDDRKFKDKFLLEINSVGAKQYRLISHRLGEHRGMLSNLIHNRATEVLQNDHSRAMAQILERIVNTTNRTEPMTAEILARLASTPGESH